MKLLVISPEEFEREMEAPVQSETKDCLGYVGLAQIRLLWDIRQPPETERLIRKGETLFLGEVAVIPTQPLGVGQSPIRPRRGRLVGGQRLG